MKLLGRITELPTPVALRVTEDPCPCEHCRSRGVVGWPEPLDEPHHFVWQCGKHALARIRLGRFWITQKQKAAFRQPSGKSNATKRNEVSGV